ncbi:hypothetical protein AH191_08690 [Salmonella enterica subsp. enterica serovar Typhimurium]|uniref:Uncharacterized protein n=1 Tax=Salmonella typhimurium TaxID=90371 RepID=A0A3V2KKM7_SALTM|nr:MULTISPECIES: hypothetical protein [Salmonella]EAB8863451.1 hypothetical protein [Salmonella enterica subsp. enterica serovar Gaminara]EBL5093906.1 hypothetical protein [Salmonella enterica subsp. enterica serovar Senftenberg]EBQ9753547.1 hypothetical protein [Salmonella enterica subsp. enterica serovar Chester]EBR8705754.1 hypothetical protein [Salmonella enterica subsp. enterica serovar Kentucky]EBS0077724.1 hypothetical protein [Salmonella enterica subsp. enterica serovar Stanley]EBX588
MHRLTGEIPQHKTKSIKLMAIVHRLQTIMVNENLTPAELVGCAEIVRDNYGKLDNISRQAHYAPPPRRR